MASDAEQHQHTLRVYMNAMLAFHGVQFDFMRTDFMAAMTDMFRKVYPDFDLDAPIPPVDRALRESEGGARP